MGVDHPGLPITWARIAREIKRVAKATLQNAAIGRAGIRVYDGGRIRFEDGGGIVIEGNGTLHGSGDFEWTGPWKFTGDGEIAGAVDIRDLLTLFSQLLVQSGGSITIDGAQPMTLSVVDGTARLSAGGGSIQGVAGGIGMTAAGNGVTVSATQTTVIGGSNAVAVSASGVTAAGPLFSTGAGTVTGVAPNVYMDPVSGRIRRIT